MAEGEVPGDYINERKDLHDCFFLVGTKHLESISSVKLLLANYSPYFRAMLFETDMKEKNSKEAIRIPDQEPDVFKMMLSYVYGCQTLHFKDTDQAMRFFMLTDKCLMPKLKEVSSKYLVEHCLSNAREVLECAVLLGIKEMEPRAKEILQKKTDKLLSSKDFLELDSKTVLYIVKQEKLNISEIELWKGLLKWARYQCGSNESDTALKKQMSRILPFVRFLTMSPKDFAEEVVKTSVLTSDESLAVLLAILTGEDLKLSSFNKVRKNRLPLNSSFKICCSVLEHGLVRKYKSEFSFDITVKNRKLKLKSIDLVDFQDCVKLCLLKDGQQIRKIEDDCDSVDLSKLRKFELSCNQNYTVRLTLDDDESSCYVVRKTEVCEHCTVTFHDTISYKTFSVIKELHFTV